ncbi:MAG: LysM domain protein [Anaerosolibacter sp.]|uniref:hypothetical protein n=1 Tax=Anaerosolibacter sp. TaxID=1872527 RepID=UPI00261C2181|nr:hypothetical protein [Anaerosolibacter sp.]MDF2547996.1 LysM domain protein [Anaerosolibacter sp.]
MKRRIYIGFTVIMLLLLLIGCVRRVEPPTVPEKPDGEIKVPAEALLEMLPTETGDQYFYNGFAEYGHIQQIDRIDEEEGKRIYHVVGMVDDPSGGEATGDFTLEMQYVVDGEKITEKILQGQKLPHKIPELEVLRLPLEEGNQWEQKMLINGTEETLKAEIESVDIDPQDKRDTYTVVYTVPMAGMPNDTYKEIRTYKKGVGLYHFESTLGKEYDFMFNYTLGLIEKKQQ